MPNFLYRARDAEGNEVQGVVEAPSIEMAQEALSDRDLTLVSLVEEAPLPLLERDIPFLSRIKVRDIVVFSRQFAVLMGAQVPIVQSLRTVARQTGNAKLRRIVVDVANEVESGTPLSVAMGNFPKAFSPFFINMIRSGETTGRLEEVMNYLADQMERDYDLMSKIKGAMIYPAFILFGLTVVGFVMMVFVIPKFTEILKESGAELPWTTKLLIAVSGFFADYAVLIAIAVVGAAVGLRFALKREGFRSVWDRQILRLPVFGPLLGKVALVKFTRSMGTMVAGGVDVPDGLAICADIVGNAAFRREIVETRKEVMDGNSITTVFAQSKVMPTMVSQMMSVGEETGRLGMVLEKLTDFYSRDLSNTVANLVSAIEPFIMLVMGLAVGVMVAAVILPMYNLASQI